MSENALGVINCARVCLVLSLTFHSDENFHCSCITLGDELLKHELLDLKHTYIIKISEKCHWNDEGARWCFVPSIVYYGGVKCVGLVCSTA